MSLNGQKSRTAVLGLLLFAGGAVVGLLAGNQSIREQLNARSMRLLIKVQIENTRPIRPPVFILFEAL